MKIHRDLTCENFASPVLQKRLGADSCKPQMNHYDVWQLHFMAIVSVQQQETTVNFWQVDHVAAVFSHIRCFVIRSIFQAVYHNIPLKRFSVVNLPTFRQHILNVKPRFSSLFCYEYPAKCFVFFSVYGLTPPS
jgi:hypothetical protein